MNRLEGAHIFHVGTWNGLEFTEADIDSIVNAFGQLQLSGRVPLKFGHNKDQPVTDGQPALGWVEKIYRKGEQLLADFRDVPKVVFDAIKSGAYKFTSIELMRPQPPAGGQAVYPYVLDAVALLGADKPAISVLNDLQSLTAMTRDRGSLSGEIVAFRLADPAIVIQESKDIMDLQEALEKVAELEKTNAALTASEAKLKAEKHTAAVNAHRAKLVEVFERGVKSESITPAQRDKLSAMLGVNDDEKVLGVTVEDVDALVKSGKPTGTSEHGRRTSFSKAGDSTIVEEEGEKTPDAILVERIEAYCNEQRLNIEDPKDRAKARRIVFSKDPALATAYMRLNDD